MNLRYDRVRRHVLNEQRHMVRHHGYVPVCPYCWERGAYKAPTDGHHFLVKKGDVQRWDPHNRELINATENVVMLCHECHMEFGQTVHMTEWCVTYKRSLGYDLEAWLNNLPFKVHSDRTSYVQG